MPARCAKRGIATQADATPRGYASISTIRVDPNNDQNIFLTGSPGGYSKDGGKTWSRIFPRMFGDFRTFWFDPENSDRMIIGGDGGIGISYDGGKTSDEYNNLPLGSIYAIGVDNEDPYRRIQICSSSATTPESSSR